MTKAMHRVECPNCTWEGFRFVEEGGNVQGRKCPQCAQLGIVQSIADGEIEHNGCRWNAETERWEALA